MTAESANAGSLPPKIPSYDYYVARVFRKRLLYYNKSAFLLAIASSLVLAVPSGSFLWMVVCTILYRAPLIYGALYSIRECRRRHSTVSFSPAKTLALQIASSVFSCRFLAILSFNLISALAIYFVYLLQLPLCSQISALSKEYRAAPAVNDDWVFFWFHAATAATIYTIQHVIFQRNRLFFRYGVARQSPDARLFANVPVLMGHSLSFTILTAITAPVAFFFMRPSIYRLSWPFFAAAGLDTAAVPRVRLTFLVIANVSFVSFVVFLLWETANHVYDVYATIGCHDGNRLISSYSADPLNTLVACLRDVSAENELLRLTAFQEIAFIATATDAEASKRRKAVYTAHSASGSAWVAILDECALVIKETASRVNFRSPPDMKALTTEKPSLVPGNGASGAHLEPSIFGNSLDASFNETHAADAVPAHLRSYQPLPPKPGFLGRIRNSIWYRQLASLAKSADKSLSGHLGSHVTSGTLKNQASSVTTVYSAYKDQFLASGPGMFFRTTLKRDTESRVGNPVNYGNAVLALLGFLNHAVEEDRTKTVTDAHVSEVPNLLERPIRACANYTDFLPASVYLSPNDEKTHNLIALLHDLTIREFFHLCLKYNYKLNDLLLSARAFKLAKWVIDASIVQQKKHSEM